MKYHTAIFKTGNRAERNSQCNSSEEQRGN